MRFYAWAPQLIEIIDFPLGRSTLDKGMPGLHLAARQARNTGVPYSERDKRAIKRKPRLIFNLSMQY